MKKVLALILCLAMCFSTVACGGAKDSAPESSEAPVIENKDTVTDVAAEAVIEETEAPVEAESSMLICLTPEQADAYYQAIMNGEVSDSIAGILGSMEEETAKIYLDVMYEFFGEKLLESLAGFSGRELDQIMAEATYVMNSRYEEAQQEEAPVEEMGDEMGYTMHLYNADTNRRIIVSLDPDHAFMEPGWAMLTDDFANYFISIDNNYEIFTLTYDVLTGNTIDLIDDRIAQDKAAGKKTNVTDTETFMAGGKQWELFAFVYERTGTGIDKETGEEVTSTYTVYEPYCFARIDDSTALFIVTGSSWNPEIMQYYSDLIQSSITAISVG